MNRVARIVGGVVTEANEYPWQVDLRNPHSILILRAQSIYLLQVGLISSEQSQVPYCGGTLLSDREVLTAAHCGASVAWVLLGEHSLAAADGEIRAKVGGLENIGHVVVCGFLICLST